MDPEQSDVRHDTGSTSVTHQNDSDMDDMEDDEPHDPAMYTCGLVSADDSCLNDDLFGPRNTTTADVSTDAFAERISSSEYQKQSSEYTKNAVQQLVESSEYQRIHTRCQLCWCCWAVGQCCQQCNECGGFAMSRPCPICEGKCGAVWSRDVDMSHTHLEAHWSGDCLLPEEQRLLHLTSVLLKDVADDDVMDAMADLKA